MYNREAKEYLPKILELTKHSTIVLSIRRYINQADNYYRLRTVELRK